MSSDILLLLSKKECCTPNLPHSSFFTPIIRHDMYLYFDRTTIALLTDLTHWGRVTHICVSKQTIIGSDNGLSPGRRQAIIWTNAGILLIATLGTNFSEILIEIRIFSFKKMGLKVSSAKWWPFCPGLNVSTNLICCHCEAFIFKAFSNPTVIGLGPCDAWLSRVRNTNRDRCSIFHWCYHDSIYRKISNIWRTKSQNLYVSRLGLQLSLCNILKPSVKLRMKM